MGYSDKPTKSKGLPLIAIITIIALLIINYFGLFNHFPIAQENMSYIAIFLVGVLTSIHCIGMCGAINLSQRSSFRYNLGNKELFSEITAHKIKHVSVCESYAKDDVKITSFKKFVDTNFSKQTIYK